MKKILTLGLAVLTTAVFGQVHYDLRVDVTDYVAAGNTIAANGLRVGGDFPAVTAVNAAGDTMAAWSPSDSTCAMTDLGNDIWGINFYVPSSAVGSTMYFKFVNGDWGSNEGTAATSTIATDGCGVDDGAGNINRTLVVGSHEALLYCWDACYQCDGSAAGITSLNERALNGVSVYPNPASDIVNIAFDAAKGGEASVRVFNVLGQTVDMFDTNVEVGENTLTWTPMVQNGTYFVEITLDGEKALERVAISK